MIDTMYHEHGQTRLLYSEEFEMCHDKQVGVVIEDTQNVSTGVQVPVLVLLVAVVALRSTMFHLKDLYIT